MSTAQKPTVEQREQTSALFTKKAKRGQTGAIVLAVIPLVGRQTVVDFGRHGSSPRYHLRGELYRKQGVQ